MHNQYAPTATEKGSSSLDEKIALYARVPHYVLITGERGSGKTTIARKLHEQSPRSKREFVSVNCASFTSELLESELFGYEKGAFTGAASAKAGLFETSAGGTLFLDALSGRNRGSNTWPSGEALKGSRRKTDTQSRRHVRARVRCSDPGRNIARSESDGSQRLVPTGPF